MFLFFFSSRRRHTRFKCDWSSDVCSSDLGWGPELVRHRPDITVEMVDKFLTKMYRNNPDFVFTVTRDFVRNCQTPVLILPDDIPAHPYAVAMEAAMLAPKAEVSLFPWKEPKQQIPPSPPRRSSAASL